MENINDKIVIYQTADGNTIIDVRLENETVWLSLDLMAKLFNRVKSVVSRHIRNVYKEGELERESTVAKNATVQIENGRRVVRQIEYFNLDVIISVGYRVKSQRGTQFRIWANRVLKDYLVKGYAVNEKIHNKQIGEMTRSRAPSVKYTRRSTAWNFIPAQKKRPRCYSTSSPRTTRSVTGTNA